MKEWLLSTIEEFELLFLLNILRWHKPLLSTIEEFELSSSVCASSMAASVTIDHRGI